MPHQHSSFSKPCKAAILKEESAVIADRGRKGVRASRSVTGFNVPPKCSPFKAGRGAWQALRCVIETPSRCNNASITKPSRAVHSAFFSSQVEDLMLARPDTPRLPSGWPGGVRLRAGNAEEPMLGSACRVRRVRDSRVSMSTTPCWSLFNLIWQLRRLTSFESGCNWPGLMVTKRRQSVGRCVSSPRLRQSSFETIEQLSTSSCNETDSTPQNS